MLSAWTTRDDEGTGTLKHFVADVHELKDSDDDGEHTCKRICSVERGGCIFFNDAFDTSTSSGASAKQKKGCCCSPSRHGRVVSNGGHASATTGTDGVEENGARESGRRAESEEKTSGPQRWCSDAVSAP